MASTFYLPAIKNISSSWKTKGGKTNGNELLKPGMKLKLKKEPDNKFYKDGCILAFVKMNLVHVMKHMIYFK